MGEEIKISGANFKSYRRGEKRFFSGHFPEKGKIELQLKSEPGSELSFSQITLREADRGMNLWCIIKDGNGEMIGGDAHPLKTSIEFPDNAFSIQIRKLGPDGHCKFVLE
ncbi:hypothetical protein ACFL24_00355 [Patescibacteria group bacterium]